MILLHLVRGRDPCHVLLENPLVESDLPQSRWVWLRGGLRVFHLTWILLVYHGKEVVSLHIWYAIGRIIECLARWYSGFWIVQAVEVRVVSLLIVLKLIAVRTWIAQISLSVVGIVHKAYTLVEVVGINPVWLRPSQRGGVWVAFREIPPNSEPKCLIKVAGVDRTCCVTWVWAVRHYFFCYMSLLNALTQVILMARYWSLKRKVDLLNITCCNQWSWPSSILQFELRNVYGVIRRCNIGWKLACYLVRLRAHLKMCGDVVIIVHWLLLLLLLRIHQLIASL